MKIAVTGHTKGIGQKLFNEYEKNGHTVLGFSRSNGYDISKEGDIDRIINETADCDLFINNAYCPGGQNTLATRWFERNKSNKSLLVNISSIAVIADNYIDDANKFKSYTDDKAILDKITWDINFANEPAKSMGISLGVVDTDMAHPNYISRFKANNTIITVNDTGSVIVLLIGIFFNNDSWFVPQIQVLNKDIF